jgi:SgrR family transcriptional regulator
VIGGIMTAAGGASGQAGDQELEYEWHRGEVVSDIWLNSANFTLPIDFLCSPHCVKKSR